MSGRIQGVTEKVYNGIKFRSTLEANTAETFDKLKVPYRYEQRKIILSKGFHCPYQKNKVHDITYTPDFEIGNNILVECKGFETPEWKIKKKLVFKYLLEREPSTKFYQIKNCKKQLLEMLDQNWTALGLAIQVIPKPSKRKNMQQGSALLFPSIQEAMKVLGIKGRTMGSILRSLIGTAQFVYGYNWKIVKIKL